MAARYAIRPSLLLLLIASPLLSRSQDIPVEVRHYFNRIRGGNFVPIPNSIFVPENAWDVLDILPPYLSDSNNVIREKTLQAVYSLSSQAADSSLRSLGVTLLLRACHDDEPSTRGTVLDFLSEFRKTDFTPAARDTLRQLIRSEVSPLDRLIRLAGFLEMTDLIPDIQPWSQPGNPVHLRWGALLSLARMGERNALANIMQRVKRLPVNDDLVYKVFPDLRYTRQPEAIAYMVDALHSDQKNCLSADVEREVPIPCGYRIMEQLAPVIEGFPLELDESGDLHTDDYPDALARVRQWFVTNGTYRIINDGY